MRIAMGIEYHGTQYHGWQKQAGLSTVQETLEHALSIIANSPIETFCAGRTDKAVHATGQVVHFDTQAERDDRAWMLGANVNLPPDIRVQWVKQIDEDFHARFSATKRRYHYWVYNMPMASAILYQRVTWHIQHLNENLMQEAANYLVGEHDFTSFRGRDCQADSPVRTIYEAKVSRHNQFVLLDICANGFLHHMVRNIMGVLLKAGNAKIPTQRTKELLLQRDRKLAEMTAPPDGLYLTEITYPEHYAVPTAQYSNFLILS